MHNGCVWEIAALKGLTSCNPSHGKEFTQLSDIFARISKFCPVTASVLWRGSVLKASNNSYLICGPLPTLLPDTFIILTTTLFQACYQPFFKPWRTVREEKSSPDKTTCTRQETNVLLGIILLICLLTSWPRSAMTHGLPLNTQ